MNIIQKTESQAWPFPFPEIAIDTSDEMPLPYIPPAAATNAALICIQILFVHPAPSLPSHDIHMKITKKLKP